MINLSNQLNNLRRAHPYYAVSNRQQFRNKSNIKSIAGNSLNSYCKRIGLSVTQITCSEFNPNLAPLPIKVNVVRGLDDSNKTAEQKVFQALKIKDELNIGRRDYIKLRNTLGKDVLPSYYSVSIMEKSLDSFFNIDKNSKGYFVNPAEKIKFVCEKFLKKKKDKKVDNNTFLIKLSGDGTKITKSSVDLLNFTFTIINDEKKATTSKGNYSLGKFHYFLNY